MPRVPPLSASTPFLVLAAGLITACSAPSSVIGSSAGTLELDAWGAANAEIPADPELLEQLTEAYELRRRREYVRVLDGVEPGELFEDAELTQAALDRGVFGLDAMFAAGDDLFELSFRPEQGLGNGLAGLAPNQRRVHMGEFGGPDAYSCSSCHSLGGFDGAGAGTQNAFFRGDGESTVTADLRNPPHLLGLGPIQALAAEMSLDLATLRDATVAEALATGAPAERPLVTHGVSFGVIRSDASGTVDPSGVDGVDIDLVVRPFGWKGHQATIRAMAVESLRIHQGVLTAADQQLVADGVLPAESYGSGPPDDLDADGVSLEVEDGMVSSLVAYLAMLEVPVVRPPRAPVQLERFARGRTLFESVGCADCHRPSLELANPVIGILPDHPDLSDRAPILVDVALDGEHPKVEPQTVFRPIYTVRLFSDLRRHDMGPELASATNQGTITPTVFLTRPLWGLSETAPYLHDGRAATIEEAILLHGGEATSARDAYATLPDDERASVRTFLSCLGRAPKMVLP